MRPLSASAALVLAAASLPAEADVLIRVNKAAQRMTVSVDGMPRYDWTVSTGKPGHETPSGTYRVQRMEKDHVSREWDDAPMPFSLFFTGQGHAIHGSGHVRSLGRPASHGCVRLPVGHAAALFALVRAEGAGTTRVVIGGGEPLVASRRTERPTTARSPRVDRRLGLPAGADAGRVVRGTYGGGVPYRGLYVPAYGYGYGWGAEGGWD